MIGARDGQASNVDAGMVLRNSGAYRKNPLGIIPCHIPFGQGLWNPVKVEKLLPAERSHLKWQTANMMGDHFSKILHFQTGRCPIESCLRQSPRARQLSELLFEGG